MERDIITVYCLIDEYLKLSGVKDDVRGVFKNLCQHEVAPKIVS